MKEFDPRGGLNFSPPFKMPIMSPPLNRRPDFNTRPKSRTEIKYPPPKSTLLGG